MIGGVFGSAAVGINCRGASVKHITTKGRNPNWLASNLEEPRLIAKKLSMTINERDFTVSPKSAELLIKQLEPSPPDSAADYLRVVLERWLAAEHGYQVHLLDNEERTLVEALRQLQRRRGLPKDLTRLLHGRTR